MSEELDDELRKRISEVFDNFEDNRAEEGWALLRQQLPTKAKRGGMAWLWWASAAAVILLFITAGILLYQPQKPNQQVAALHTKNNQLNEGLANETPAPQTQPMAKTQTDVVDNEPKRNKTALTNVTNNYKNQLKAKPNNTSIKDIAAAKARGAIGTIIDSANGIASTVNKGEDNSDTNTPRTQQADKTLPAYATTKATGKQTIIEKTTPAEQSVIAERQSPVLAMINKDAERNTNAKTTTTKAQPAVNFGIYAATFFNYAKGSDNQVNLGAGVSSDFRITKNLKLSTGIAIAQNSFNYGGNQEALPMAAADASLVAKSVKTEALGFNVAASAPTLESYNAKLIGLEIPLNLKFEFSPGKTSTYVLAGVSSGTFINQSYGYNFNYASPLSKSDNQTVKETIDEPSVSNFYFAKTLNFGFGIGYPVGNGNRLVVEPFVKYPLDGLGAQQIKFGAGGINLRFNFGSKK